jgi:hypothetical protein
VRLHPVTASFHVDRGETFSDGGTYHPAAAYAARELLATTAGASITAFISGQAETARPAARPFMMRVKASVTSPVTSEKSRELRLFPGIVPWRKRDDPLKCMKRKTPGGPGA